MIDRRTALQFARFSAVGLLGAVAHYTVLIGAVELLALSPVTGAVLGAAAGAAVNYTLARLFVFDARRGHAGAIPRFLAAAAASMALNGAAMALLVEVLGLPYIPAQVLVTVALATVNYLASRYWAFRDGAVS